MSDVQKSGVVAVILLAVWGCGDGSNHKDGNSIVRDDLDVTIKANHSDTQHFSINNKQQELSLDSFPMVFADGEWTKSPSVLLSAKTIEINDDEIAVSLSRHGDLLTIRTQNGAESEFQVGWDGSKLTVVDVFEAEICDEEAAGFLLWRFVEAYSAKAEGAGVEQFNPTDLSPKAITACFYICYEMWIGVGSFVCKHYPRGIYYDFSVVFLDLPRARGYGRVTFYCNALWYWSREPGPGT